MSFEAKKWQETEGPCLRNFDEKEAIESVQGALALRPQIEAVIDRIWEEGFDGIFFIGIGGTYASAMQVEVYMRGRSSLPIYVENAAELTVRGHLFLGFRQHQGDGAARRARPGNRRQDLRLYRHAGFDADRAGQAGLSDPLSEERAAEVLYGRKLSHVQKRRVRRL